jgi:hypothetical protein
MEFGRWVIRSSDVCLFVSKLQDFKFVHGSLSNRLSSFSVDKSDLPSTSAASTPQSTTVATTSISILPSSSVSISMSVDGMIEIISSIPLILGLTMNGVDKSASLLVATVHSVIAIISYCTTSVLILSSESSVTTMTTATGLSSSGFSDLNTNRRVSRSSLLKDAIKNIQRVLQYVAMICSILESECSANPTFTQKLLSLVLTVDTTEKNSSSVDLKGLFLSLCTDIDVSVQKLLLTALNTVVTTTATATAAMSSFSGPTTITATSAHSESTVTSTEGPMIDNQNEEKFEMKSDVKSPITALLPQLHDTKRQLKALKLILLSAPAHMSSSASSSLFVLDRCNKTD